MILVGVMNMKMLLVVSDYQMYQYFIQVVPTKVNTAWNSFDTYQYAVTEKV